MKKSLILFSFMFCFLLQENKLHAQQFLNGSFEPVDDTCGYSLSNAAFGLLENNCYAFGTAEQIEIMNFECGFGAAQNGSHFIGLGVPPNGILYDAVSLALDTQLLAGNNYNLIFYQRIESIYVATVLYIGYSNDSSSFGTLIDSVLPPQTTNWDLYSLNFTPLNNAKYITAKIKVTAYHWNLVDNFSIASATAVDEIKEEKNNVTVFPNPAADFINLEIKNNVKFYSATVKDLSGKIIAVTDKTTINIHEFANGVYFLEIKTNSGSEVKKIIKN